MACSNDGFRGLFGYVFCPKGAVCLEFSLLKGCFDYLKAI